MDPRRFARLAAACFFATGATSLVYQVVWSRYLALSFGSDHYSVAAVVAAYMLGLGLGSQLFGRLADRLLRPARLYALLELAIAAYGLLSPLLLGVVERAFLAFHRAAEPGPALATASRLLLALLTLALPTLLMGGTLPVLGRALVRDGERVASDIGLLYAANTLGAVAGALGAGFVLIERLGLWGSLVAAAVVNALAGAAVLAARPGAPPTPAAAGRSSLRELLAPASARFALAAAAAAGFASLVDEIVWTRVVGLLTGSSTYAFTIILSCFLLGIGIGARAVSGSALGEPGRTLARAQILAAAGALLLLRLFAPATWLIVAAAQSPLLDWRALLAVRGGIAALAIVPATIGFGASFPALVALAARDPRRAGAHVGLLYAANTLGAILGSIAGGFLLLRWFSSFAVLRGGALVSLAIAAGGLCLARGGPRRHPGTALCGLLVLGFACTLSPWPAHLMDAGAPIYMRNRIGSRLALESFLEGGRNDLMWLREGPVATVTVRDSGYARFLRVNGKTDASDAGDMVSQVMLGLVPAIVHAGPRRVLVIGAGSGVTARAVLDVPGVESVTLAEIEPAVIDALALFEHVNGGVQRDARLEVVLEDGRNHLLTTERRYDLIVSEPSNPWMAGIANLFTREFYDQVRLRLAERGVFCQWVQRYGLSEDTLRRMVATLLVSFPEVEMWRGSGGDSFFLASAEPMVLDLGRARAVLEAQAERRPHEAAVRLGVETPEDLASYFLLGRASLGQFAGHARPFHDDPPELEFAAFRDLDAPASWQGRINHDLLSLKSLGASLAPRTRPGLSQANRLGALGQAALALHDPAAAVSWLEQATALSPRPLLLRWLATARLENGDSAGAFTSYAAAASAGDARAAGLAAGLALARGEDAEAKRLAERASPLDPDGALVRATLAAEEGDWPRASRELESALDSPGAKAPPFDALARATPLLWRLAAPDALPRETIAALQTRLEERPRWLELRELVARLLAADERCRDAVAEFRRLRASGKASTELAIEEAACLDRLGRGEEARRLRAWAREREPWSPEIARAEAAARSVPQGRDEE